MKNKIKEKLRFFTPTRFSPKEFNELYESACPVIWKSKHGVERTYLGTHKKHFTQLEIEIIRRRLNVNYLGKNAAEFKKIL